MASAASLSEPQVLVHTKRRLFPDTEQDDVYAVTDTQFATDEWLADRPIRDAIRTELAPFNHVRLGSGYPDLVGVRKLEDELLAVERFGDQPPLVAVEAKGHAGGAPVDVERGVVQAYDRLGEANAAYVAAPADAITEPVQTLASELNVGVLGVDASGSVEPLVVPRVVGNHTSDEASAIRFQATAQGVADKSFSLNHPKNYLGYPLALYDTADTAELLSTHVVGDVAGARTGAAFLGLVDEAPDGVRLTSLGDEVVRFALERYGSVRSALEAFEAWKRSRERFCDLAPEWGLLTRRILWAYPATELLVRELQARRDHDVTDHSLVDLVEWLHEQYPTFTVELFLRGTEAVRSRVLDGDGRLQRAELTDGGVYHAPTVFQLKAMLFHGGILTERGAEPDRLDPLEDEWKLRQPLDRTP